MMTRPFVKVTSSRIWESGSDPDCMIAGVMNLLQTSRSLRDFLSILSLKSGHVVYGKIVTGNLLHIVILRNIWIHRGKAMENECGLNDIHSS